ncbi:MAG: hypothetical protein ACTHMY_13445 [Solirubrobacteraceae bacterium]
MYSQQLLRINHDEWLRYAETRRMVKQARAAARQNAPARRRTQPQRSLFGGLALRRPLRHA